MTLKPIHILFVLPSFAGGGAERVALTLLQNLDRSRFSASVVVLTRSGPLAELVPDDFAIVDLGKTRLRNALMPLIAAIRKAKPDFVFSTLGYVNLALLAIRRVLPKKTRIVVREANMPSLSIDAMSSPSLLRSAYRFLYRKADTVICTSKKMMGEMEREFSVPAATLYLLFNPVDATAIREAAVPARRHLGHGLRIVAAGRLTRQKGFDRLIEMLALLSKDAHLTILGEGPEQENLEAIVGKMNLARQVVFENFNSNPWAFYAGADVFVLSSRWEGMPNAALESLACGTPVVATPQSGGIAEVMSIAPVNAVRIAEAGEPIIAILNDLPGGLESRSFPRPSLLPTQFLAADVTSEFQDLLIRLFTTPPVSVAE